MTPGRQKENPAKVAPCRRYGDTRSPVKDYVMPDHDEYPPPPAPISFPLTPPDLLVNTDHTTGGGRGAEVVLAGGTAAAAAASSLSHHEVPHGGPRCRRRRLHIRKVTYCVWHVAIAWRLHLFFFPAWRPLRVLVLSSSLVCYFLIHLAVLHVWHFQGGWRRGGGWLLE